MIFLFPPNSERIKLNYYNQKFLFMFKDQRLCNTAITKPYFFKDESSFIIWRKVYINLLLSILQVYKITNNMSIQASSLVENEWRISWKKYRAFIVTILHILSDLDKWSNNKSLTFFKSILRLISARLKAYINLLLSII